MPRPAGPCVPTPGGSRGRDDYFARDYARNIGAEIMGRNKFGPQRGPWQDHEWCGWWGDKPPFRTPVFVTPVFVMTHHKRPSFRLSDTTFHFAAGDPATVLEQAREAAQGEDVRLGGGVTTIRQFLDADLVDAVHVAVSPVKLGSGLRQAGAEAVQAVEIGQGPLPVSLAAMVNINALACDLRETVDQRVRDYECMGGWDMRGIGSRRDLAQPVGLRCGHCVFHHSSTTRRVANIGEGASIEARRDLVRGAITEPAHERRCAEECGGTRC